MLNTQGKIKFSEYAVLYDMLIPADNKYRLIDELIDFSFIYDELKDKYCLDNGRKAAYPKDLHPSVFDGGTLLEGSDQ